jgi:hypothetical protein
MSEAESRVDNFDTICEFNTKLTDLDLCLTGLGRKRVDPFILLKRVVSQVTRG